MRKLLFGGAALALATSLVFACTLDLDESLIGKPPKDGGGVTLGDVNLPDGTIISESGVPIVPSDAVNCTTDNDCPTTNGCLKGRCDQTRRACAYDICHAASCAVGVCDQAAKTCNSTQMYKEKAGELVLDQVTTGGIIAAYPWLFQMTTTGILVYDVSNPTKGKPVSVPLVGLGFVPNQFARSGNRIWIMAPLGGTPARLPIAYIDVPADPFTGKIEAHTILANYNRPATESVSIGPSENKGALILGPAPTYPTAAVDTLLAEPATKTATPIVPRDNSTPVALSGSRIVMQGIQPLTNQATNQFGLVSGAGTTNPTTSDLVTVADLAAPSLARAATQSVDGTVFFATGTHGPGPAPDTIVTRTVRGYFLVKDGKSTIDGAVKGVDLETYAPETAPGANGDSLRAPTMVDLDTAMVVVAATESPGTATAVQFMKRDGTVDRAKRVTLATSIGTIAGSSASDGFVYIAANIPSGQEGVPPTAKVFVIDPACSP